MIEYRIGSRQEWLTARTELLEAAAVLPTYSSYARAGDAFWSRYQWLDRAPRGRNETPGRFRLHDEYDDQVTDTRSIRPD